MDAGVIDHEARRTAGSAMQAIQSHENHCGERWAEARKAADDLRGEVRNGFAGASETARRLHARVDRIIWAVAAAAVGILIQAVLMWIGQ